MFKKNAFQWACVPAVTNCRKQRYRPRDWRALSDHWEFYGASITWNWKAGLLREMSQTWSWVCDLEGQYGNVRLPSKSTACPLAAVEWGWVIGIVYRQERVAEWDFDMRQSDILSIYVVFYVCKGQEELGQSWDYSFPKMDHSLHPTFFFCTKTTNLPSFPQRQISLINISWLF